MKYHFDLAAVLHGEYGALFLKGIKLTLLLTGEAWVLAMVIGIFLSLIHI